MRIIVFIICSILLIAPAGAQNLQSELIQVSLEFQIAFQLVREGQAGLNLELIGLQNELSDWQKKEEKWKLEENGLRNELEGSKQEAIKLRQDLSSAREQTSGLEKSFSDYKTETEKSRTWSKLWNKILIIGLITEAIIILIK